MRKRFFRLGKTAGLALRIFSERGARFMSGSIAFYALLSVVPILVIALHVATVFVAPDRVTPTLARELEHWVGPGGASTLLSLANQAQAKGASLLSAITLIYASTRLFSQLTTALDLLWNTPPPPRAKGFGERALRQLERRGLAFGMVVLAGIFLVALVLIHAAFAGVRNMLGVDAAPASHWIEGAASFAISAVLFTLVFRVLPSEKVSIADAVVGGAVTAILFTLGSLAITAYVTRRDITLFGAASSIVMLLLWLHYSAHVFFLGAAFTAAHARRAEG